MAHTPFETMQHKSAATASANPVVYADFGPAWLTERAIARGEGALAANGSLVVRTGRFTGRSARDKYFVADHDTSSRLWAANQQLSQDQFHRLYQRTASYLGSREVYVQDLLAGADPRYAVPVRVISEYAWHSLFIRQLLVRPGMFAGQTERQPRKMSGFAGMLDEPPAGSARLTMLVAPGCLAAPVDDGTQSETYIAIDLGRRIVAIGGTEYAGEIKKSVFTFLNYYLPDRGVFPMHCSANVGRESEETALFFGLSGTGKTTISADPSRDLIGDDEHGWSDEGVFNFEGGCYAKCIRLSEVREPEIWSAVRFGTVLENVVMDPETRRLDFDSDRYTENTRAAYPIENIPHARVPGAGGHPRHIVFLTADAFGVLPPISRLTPAQARFHFISGYTAKVAGTERGLGTEPEATFSACFAQPFLPRPPHIYSKMLGDRLARHHAAVWLVNTGWTGGPFGAGQRMDLRYTRAMVDAAIEGRLDGADFRTEPFFDLQVPVDVPGVPAEVLDPRRAWPDPKAYDRQARRLVRLFLENFERHRATAAPEVAAAAPRPPGED